MMRFLRIVLLACICFLQQNTFAQGGPNDVVILMGKEDIPADAKLLGKIKVGSGFSFNRGYEKTMRLAKARTVNKECNLVCIRKLKHPDFWSTSYRLRADVYYVADMEGFKKRRHQQLDSVLQTMLPKNAPHALLYVYRPRSHVGSAISYNMHVNDSKVCRVTNESKYVVQLQPGKTNIWARTEARDEVDIDVKPGTVYFLRCGVKAGWVVGRPDIYLVDAYQALQECKDIDFSEPEKDVSGGSIYR